MKRRSLALVLALATLTSGCFASLTGDPAPKPAPPFRVVDTQGAPHDLASYNGSVLVIDLMATWCVPCQAEMEHLKTVRASYPPGKLQILSIDTDSTESPEQIDAFAKRFGATWPFATDYDSIARDYGLRILPKLIIVSPDGQIVFENQGETYPAAIARVANRYIGAAA